MSGGVDSSVAAMKLVEDDFNVTGVTFRLPYFSGAGNTTDKCCGTAGIEDARRVCHNLGIRHYTLDFREKFDQHVLQNFYDEYSKGRTPNPCILCNDKLKFGALIELAKSMNADSVATGHYVRKSFSELTGCFELLKGVDGEDQSYFLFSLSQEQLKYAHFPLGNLTKEQVRSEALEAGLKVHDKPKSQDLCFVPGDRYQDLFRQKKSEMLQKGNIRHIDGKVLGRHDGIALYTVGQRKGLGIAWTEPLYVLELSPESNEIIVGERRHLSKNIVDLKNVNWILPAPEINKPFCAVVKIRFRHPGASALVCRKDNDAARVIFDSPQNAPTPGQAAVFYKGENILGGGIIHNSCKKEQGS